VLIIYFNAFIVCFNLFQCISMCLNVFIDIVIGISPLHSHRNVFAMHTHLQIFFSVYTMTPFPTCYTTIIFFPFHWSIPTFIQSIKKLHINPYFSHLYITPHSTFHIPHSTFHIITNCVEHSELKYIFSLFWDFV
jgi:hypothetical protein